MNNNFGITLSDAFFIDQCPCEIIRLMIKLLYKSGENMFYIYMIRCQDNSIYTGITTDLKRRFDEHKNKDKGARYTMTHNPLKIECAWATENKSLASKLEFHLKRLSKNSKEDIIKKNNLNKYLLEKIDINKYVRIEREQYE